MERSKRKKSLGSWTRIETPERNRGDSIFVGGLKKKRSTATQRNGGVQRMTLCLPHEISITSNFALDEIEYQKILRELSVIIIHLPARKETDPISKGIDENVIGCIGSSIAMMQIVSKDVVDLLETICSTEIIQSTNELDSDSDSEENEDNGKGQTVDEILNQCRKIIDVLSVYEAFCNNENGICHSDLLPLYLNSPCATKLGLFTHIVGKPADTREYSELILYPFLAVARYQDIFTFLSSYIPMIGTLIEKIQGVRKIVAASKNKILKSIKFISQIKHIKELPEKFVWLTNNREMLKYSPVRKQRTARPKDKERMFFLCNDILIYCTMNNVYRGMFFCNQIRVKDILSSPTQFQMFISDDRFSFSNEGTKYTITADSCQEKQDWIQKFHTASTFQGVRRDSDMNIRRELHLTSTEANELDVHQEFTSHPVSNDLKDSAECLNAAVVWNSKTRPALDVAIALLGMLMEIYTEHRGILERFDVEGFGIIAVNASFLEFEGASAELQQVNLHDMCAEERFLFWINIYNTLSLHSLIRQKSRRNGSGASNFQTSSKYYIGSHIFSLALIEHGILRANLHCPSFITSSKTYPKLKKNDPRSDFVVEGNPLVNFALNVGSISSPPVILYTPENWDEQLKKQAKLYCQQHIRLFLHSNQRKICLPKLFNLYERDFASSQRALLIHIRDSFLSSSQQQELCFLDDSSISISARYESPEWSFKYPIGKEDMKEIKTNLIEKEYVLLINQEHVYVRDSLEESKFAFIIPFQFLKLLQPIRRQQLKVFGQKMGRYSILTHCYERMVEHLDLITKAIPIYSQYVTYSGDYKGLSFRPSTYKVDPILQFVPVNLQRHCTEVSHSKDLNPIIATLLHVTFGAPAAHLYRFKNGQGLRQFIQHHHKLEDILRKEHAIDLEHELLETEEIIRMRLDICVPQALTAFITGMDQALSNHPKVEYFEEIQHCGILVQFESLLSTHGSEMGMIGDMDVAVRFLGNFKVKFIPVNPRSVLNPRIVMADSHVDSNPESDSSYSLQMNSFPSFVIEWQLGNISELPLALQEGGLVHIKPLFFTQGINEHQSVAIRLGETKLQEMINQENMVLLAAFYMKWNDYQVSFRNKDCSSYTNRLEEIGEVISSSKNEKNVQILSRTADFVRLMGGLRLTSCKSAKDRTAMSITWEQGRFLNSSVSLPDAMILKIANDMRSRGVRRENAFRNIGKQKFKFNSFQKNSLPKEYQLRNKS